VGRAGTNGSKPQRVQVRLTSGDIAYPTVAEERLIDELACGDAVLVDAQIRCLLFRETAHAETGEVARFERRWIGNSVLVTLRDHETQVLLAADPLMKQLDADRVPVGQQLLVCAQRKIAFCVVGQDVSDSKYRFLVREPVPDVIIERDIGDPPSYIQMVLDHVARELRAPETARKYRIRRPITTLLAGVTGTGKTLSIQALIRALYELMAQHTGVPIGDLPPRVLRLRMSAVLSKWLGESDKGLSRFVDELLEIADQKLRAPDGRQYELPTIVVVEECDSLGRERGGMGDQIYDRLQSTFLEHFDTNSHRFGSKLIVAVCTTNVPTLMDAAFVRRIGGTICYFGRLSRKSFASVLEKHLRGLPISADCGADQLQRERRLLRDTLDWFYAAAGQDVGVVEVTYVGSAHPVVFHARDILTAGLVDRAVQEAARTACCQECSSDGLPGITSAMLLKSFDRQVRSTVDQLAAHNVHNYLTLPDGVRVAQVRRIERPHLRLRELQRRIV
jgi:ATP-dependent 26S proteasome regulatory subunit